MDNFPSQAVIEQRRVDYAGRRIKFLRHLAPDPRPLPVGLEGLCESVDGIGQLQMRWDDGRTLAISPDSDSFEVSTSLVWLGVESAPVDGTVIEGLYDGEAVLVRWAKTRRCMGAGSAGGSGFQAVGVEVEQS